MSKTIELDGKKYKLVPLEDAKMTSVTFYYGCDSDCGHFRFSVLLNDDGNIWKDTQSVTYYPEGATNTNKSEHWDNWKFLKNILDNPDDKDVVKLKGEIKKEKFENLLNLLQQVRIKGWI
jgi:hypothetical protein